MTGPRSTESRQDYDHVPGFDVAAGPDGLDPEAHGLVSRLGLRHQYGVDPPAGRAARRAVKAKGVAATMGQPDASGR